MPHWTSTDDDSFIGRITFDFIAQLEHKLETSGTTQSEMARKMNVTEGAVSQILNLGRTNLNLRTMVKCARALGMKLAVVAYDDGDPQNERGPVGSEIFANCWDRTGRPRDIWSLDANLQTAATDQGAIGIGIILFNSNWGLPEFVNSTLSQNSIRMSASNDLQLSAPVVTVGSLKRGGTEAHARIEELPV